MTLTVIPTHPTAEPSAEPQDVKGFELVNGQLVEKRMSRGSSRAGLTIGYLFECAARRCGGVEVHGSELGYRCFAPDPRGYRKPDVSVIRTDRLAGVPTDVGLMPVPADLVVEVLSPNDLAYRVSQKVRLYLDNGFRTVWVVDPSVRTVAVFTADAPGRVLRETDEIDAGDLLPGFRCKVADFFGAPAAPPAAGDAVAADPLPTT
jgi:Uma2 family endonuclease